MSDNTFKRHEARLDSPGFNAEAIPVSGSSGSIHLTTVSRGIYIGTSGDLRVRTLGGQDVLFTGVVGGTLLPIRITEVFNSGTTASGLVSLY